MTQPGSTLSIKKRPAMFKRFQLIWLVTVLALVGGSAFAATEPLHKVNWGMSAAEIRQLCGEPYAVYAEENGNTSLEYQNSLDDDDHFMTIYEVHPKHGLENVYVSFFFPNSSAANFQALLATLLPLINDSAQPYEYAYLESNREGRYKFRYYNAAWLNAADYIEMEGFTPRETEHIEEIGGGYGLRFYFYTNANNRYGERFNRFKEQVRQIR